MILVSVILVAQTNPWIKKPPGGGQASLVAVTDPILKRSWQPDGKRLPIWVFPETLKQIEGASYNPQQVVSFVFRLRPKSQKSLPSVSVLLGSEQLGYSFVLQDTERSGVWWAGAGKSAKKMPAKVDLRLGLADGAWKSVARYDIRASKATGVPFLKSLRHTSAGRETDVVMDATIPSGLVSAYRFKVFTSSGAVILDGRSPGRRDSYYFQTGAKPPIAIEMQSRPYRWVAFTGVRPRPRA